MQTKIAELQKAGGIGNVAQLKSKVLFRLRGSGKKTSLARKMIMKLPVGPMPVIKNMLKKRLIETFKIRKLDTSASKY